MADDLTPDQRIAQLGAELAALRASQAGSRGPLHPAVQPRYFIGAVVLYADAPYRVTGRSIAWDGSASYTLRAVAGSVVHVYGPPTARLVARYDLAHPSARAVLDGLRSYDLTHPDDAEAVFDVPETDLAAFHAHDTHVYAVAAEAVRAGRASDDDLPVVSEAASVIRS